MEPRAGAQVADCSLTEVLQTQDPDLFDCCLYVVRMPPTQPRVLTIRQSCSWEQGSRDPQTQSAWDVFEREAASGRPRAVEGSC